MKKSAGRGRVEEVCAEPEEGCVYNTMYIRIVKDVEKKGLPPPPPPSFDGFYLGTLICQGTRKGYAAAAAAAVWLAFGRGPPTVLAGEHPPAPGETLPFSTDTLLRFESERTKLKRRRGGEEEKKNPAYFAPAGATCRTRKVIRAN